MAPLWPEWNEADINTESWDAANLRKRDTGGGRNRADTKTNIQMVREWTKNYLKYYSFFKGVHIFDDPEGKVELPSSFKVDQWRRPIDFLAPDRVRQKLGKMYD